MPTPLTRSPAGETDNDSGSAANVFGGVEAKSSGGNGAAPFSITVNDPSPTPEPASIFLFGSGLLGMVGFLRRKLLC